MTRPAAPLARLATLAGLAVASLAVWAAPRVAQACSCAPWLEIQAPLDGGTHPANGLLLIDAECGSAASDLEVYVDGEPAMLVGEPHRMVGEGYTIHPAPEPGDYVEILACPGWDSCEEAEQEVGEGIVWGQVERAFTVGDRDRVAPAAPVLGGLDYLIEDVEQFCSIEDAPRPAREWSFTLDGRADEPVFYYVTVGPAGSDDPTRISRMVLQGDEDLEISLRRFEEDAGREVCATVRTFDLAGNEGDAVSTCTELGRFETLDGEGCACSTSGRGSGGLGAALLVLLGGLARRRRRR